MIQKRRREWKKIFGRGEGRATDGFGAISALAWLVVWWRLLSFSFGDGLDECIGLCWGGPVAMISLIAAHSSILNMALTVCLINLRNMLMSLHTLV